MVKVEVIDLLSSDPLRQTCFEFCLDRVVDVTDTHLDGLWSKLRIIRALAADSSINLVTTAPGFDVALMYL